MAREGSVQYLLSQNADWHRVFNVNVRTGELKKRGFTTPSHECHLMREYFDSTPTSCRLTVLATCQWEGMRATCNGILAIGLVAFSAVSARVASAQQPVNCSVFDDGNSDIAGPSSGLVVSSDRVTHICLTDANGNNTGTCVSGSATA